jgi:hypothetical protein
MEGSLVAYKVFTNGSVLNASEVNDNLMNQAVITFSNSTARGSAITTPVEGMVSYLEDTNSFEYWDGSSWTTLTSNDSGLVHIVTRSLSGITSESFNNVFSSQYDDYLVIIDGSASTAAAGTIRFRASGTDDSSNEYLRQFLVVADTSISSGQSTATSFSLGTQNVNKETNLITLSSPFKSLGTRLLVDRILGITASFSLQKSAGFHNVATSYDGFSFTIASGTWTGQVSIYGYRKS